MIQKNDKAIRRAAVKYAVREEKKIAQYIKDDIYNRPLMYRIIYALGVIFRWGKKHSAQ